MQQKIYIKNMVCPRCTETVRSIFENLEISIEHIELGEVIVPSEISNEKKRSLNEALLVKGFELLQDQKSKLIGQIKSTIIDQIHHQQEHLKVNFSTLLEEKLHHDYSSLSRLFSSIEGITIEKYIVKQKTEKVKELIFYNELNLSEIAYQMNYSSVAHLSAQFKKETGMTPSQFRTLRKPDFKSLDSI